MLKCRVAGVAQARKRHLTKSLDSDENFKPEHTLFCRKLRFVAIYALFGDLWAKKVPLWVKISQEKCAKKRRKNWGWQLSS